MLERTTARSLPTQGHLTTALQRAWLSPAARQPCVLLALLLLGLALGGNGTPLIHPFSTEHCWVALAAPCSRCAYWLHCSLCPLCPACSVLSPLKTTLRRSVFTPELGTLFQVGRVLLPSGSRLSHSTARQRRQHPQQCFKHCSVLNLGLLLPPAPSASLAASHSAAGGLPALSPPTSPSNGGLSAATGMECGCPIPALFPLSVQPGPHEMPWQEMDGAVLSLEVGTALSSAGIWLLSPLRG